MPQIAQQDYLYINLADYGLGSYALDELTDYVNPELWAALERFAENKTILDAIFTNGEQFARVCSFEYENGKLSMVEYVFAKYNWGIQKPND